MSNPPEVFYSEERWQNWIDRLQDEDINPEEEQSARLLLNLQDDAAIGVAKILNAYDADELDETEALGEIHSVRDIILAEVEVEDEETAFLLDGVQTSLICVFAAAEEYIASGQAEDGNIEEFVFAAAEAESEDDIDSALVYCAQAGTRIIGGDDMDISIVEEFEYGLVTEWVNGLDSLQSALRDPEVVEEDE